MKIEILAKKNKESDLAFYEQLLKMVFNFSEDTSTYKSAATGEENESKR